MRIILLGAHQQQANEDPTSYLASICLIHLKAQTIDKEYIVKWVKMADTTLTLTQ